MMEMIAKQAAIDTAKDLLIEMDEFRQYNQAINNYCAELMKLPSVQPEQKKGKWILDDGTPAICSECGTDWIYDYVDSRELYFTGKIPNYCPNCGSDNRGEQDE